MQDLLQLCHPKATFKCLCGITLVFPGLMVGMLSQLPGLPYGVLGGQVQSELFHPGLECNTGQQMGHSLEGLKDSLSLLLHPSIVGSMHLGRQ